MDGRSGTGGTLERMLMYSSAGQSYSNVLIGRWHGNICIIVLCRLSAQCSCILKDTYCENLGNTRFDIQTPSNYLFSGLQCKSIALTIVSVCRNHQSSMLSRKYYRNYSSMKTQT